MRIGDLARAAGVAVDTIRFYEKRGLLPAPERSDAGYRSYGGEDLARVRFVRRAKALGFELREIGELLALRVDADTTCAEVRQRAAAKVAEIEKRIDDMEALRKALVSLASTCIESPNGPTRCALLVHLMELEESDD